MGVEPDPSKLKVDGAPVERSDRRPVSLRASIERGDGTAHEISVLNSPTKAAASKRP